MNLSEILKYSEEDMKTLIEFNIEQAETYLEYILKVYLIKYTPRVEDAYMSLSELENGLLEYYKENKVKLLTKIQNKKLIENLREDIDKREEHKELFLKFKKIKKTDSKEYGELLDKINECYTKDKECYLINKIDKFLGGT